MSSHYKPDGIGRDGYINYDNGGLYLSYNADLQPQWGTFMEKKKSDMLDKSLCHIPTKHVAYSSNGTGRDSYIV